MEIGFSESVLEIKQKIEQDLGIEVPTQNIRVYGLELIDGLDMGDYPIIGEGTRIDLNIKKKELVIEIDPYRIQIVLMISKWKTIIEVDRTEMMNENYRSLCEYGICQRSEVSEFYRNVNHPTRSDQPSAKRLSLVVQTTAVLNSCSRTSNGQYYSVQTGRDGT
ncbi:hypothetical protein MKW98_015971 [Papaver atlanticum]|uniref:Ubiquitin-like domain-containing protein n=1 Tax=Papaver atlanticum TaxID=357466 RepID=A0AAD4RW16_9MAGN|nr:hypothetical protein MKW98_015971 [Papaver atlanticum]